MDSNVTKAVRVPKILYEPKLHDAICCELVKISKKISYILPAIESAQPGCSSGIQLLCSLNNTLEKCKLLVHYCSNSSKLYLALTADSIALRSERIRTQLTQCLCQIQTVVPTRLASQITEVLDYLRDIKFVINPKEEEAGKILSNLLSQNNSSEDQECEAFQKASSRLNITSSTALLVERRAMKKLLDKFHNVDDKKVRILMYFLYLLKTYGNKVIPSTGEQKEHFNAQNSLNEKMSSESDSSMIVDSPPEEFFCPISSSLMFDPVIIASGITYERIFVEKWFSEGHQSCPKTKKKLENVSLTPNSSLKALILSWCRKHGIAVLNPQPGETDIQALESIRCSSVSSLKNISMALLDGRKISSLSSSSCCSSNSSHCKDTENSNNNYETLFSWSPDYQNHQSFSSFSQDMYLKFLYHLSELPSLVQVKAMEEMRRVIEGEEEVAQCGLLFSGFTEALMVFLKKVCSMSDSPAQRCGAQIFLEVVSNQRWELNFEIEDTIQLLSSLLNCGIDKEALMILQKVSLHPNSLPFIATSDIPLKLIKFIYSKSSQYVEISLKILSDLSSNGEMRSHFLISRIIEKISQLLGTNNLVRFSLNILQNLVIDEEASILIAEANGCITAMAELLEFGQPEQEEVVVVITILLSLCSRSSRNCLLVLKEGVIPSLVNVSVNGSVEGKEKSLRLLHVLRDVRQIDCDDSLQPHSEPQVELTQLPLKKSKKIVSLYKPFGFLSRKMKLVSKSLVFF